MPGQRSLCQLLHPQVQLVQLMMELYSVILDLRDGGPEQAKVLSMAVKGQNVAGVVWFTGGRAHFF